MRRLKGRVLGGREETNTQPGTSSSPQPVFDSTRLASGLGGAQAPRQRPRRETLGGTFCLPSVSVAVGGDGGKGQQEMEVDSQECRGTITCAIRVAAAGNERRSRPLVVDAGGASLSHSSLLNVTPVVCHFTFYSLEGKADRLKNEEEKNGAAKETRLAAKSLEGQ